MTHNLHHNFLRSGLGLAFVGLGAAFLLQELSGSRVSLIRLTWPFIPLLVGLGLLAAFVLGGRAVAALALPATMLTVVGAILLVQLTTHRFETWAYAHTLVFPTATGLGLWLWGVTDERPQLVRVGRWLISAGVVLFGIGVLFFEGVVWRGLLHGGTLAGLLFVLAGGYLMLRSGPSSGFGLITTS